MTKSKDVITQTRKATRRKFSADAKVWIDGESFLSIFGTGTKDYYAYSYGGQNRRVDYSVATYWYGRPGVKSNAEPSPEGAGRKVRE